MGLYLRTNKDHQRIDQQRLNVLTLHFDHRELMTVDREVESWVARDRNQAESVTDLMGYVKFTPKYVDRKNTYRVPC